MSRKKSYSDFDYDYEDFGGGWPRYRSVAERRQQAQREAQKLTKKGKKLNPVIPQAGRGQKIAQTFWGQAWCRHMEAYHDYESRLPRGRSYLRNGSVIHLDITEGKIQAKVSGSTIYDVSITLDPLNEALREEIVLRCSGQIGSLLELLSGRFSDEVMAVMAGECDGLLPTPQEIKMSCNCPDWADMCKHLAAVLYGVGVRLDEKPELLFTLRAVNPADLIEKSSAQLKSDSDPTQISFDQNALEQLFGIELDMG